MIEFRSETLFAPRIFRWRIRAANVATDDPAGFTQPAERPLKIGDREPAVLPICHRLFDAQAIKIDGHIDIFVSEAVGKLLKTLTPILTKNCAPPLLIFGRPIVCPRMHFKNSSAFSATVPKNLVWPPAFEITAAPNCRMLDLRKFQRAIDPATTSPSRGAHIPIRMVVERNEHDWLSNAAQSKRGQIMKVARAVK